jgi:acetyl/propionyl-CoA carboxylase alpha subunit/acetyl-CoA carboxylase carboxyltransferase component
MLKKLLIANRGEIALRIARTANELGITTLAIYSQDDANSLHIKYCDESQKLPGTGVNAYLNIANIIEIATNSNCDAIHPGYGLLSESADFANASQKAGLIFVGPSATVLQQLGDKVSARTLAKSANIAVIEGSDNIQCAEDVTTFFNTQGKQPIMIKAVNGGGGRGMRVVHEQSQIPAAFERCQAESLSAFGSTDLYVERYLSSVRHVEVQIVGDGEDIIHLWERDCSIQRRNQKLLEVAPAPGLSADIKQQLFDAAICIGKACDYVGLGTIEFLLETNTNGEVTNIFFIEANPRIQVEHTITEAITGLDLVAIQLRLAANQTLGDIGLLQKTIPKPNGYALQARINTEVFNVKGEMVPTGGTLQQVQFPGGLGIRVDSYAYPGYTTNPNFDSLLAKLIVHTRSSDFSRLIAKAESVLSEVNITGVGTNIDFLRRLLQLPAIKDWQVNVRGVESSLKDLHEPQGATQKQRYATSSAEPTQPQQSNASIQENFPDDISPIRTPLQSVLVSVEVAEGNTIKAGEELAVLEAMKMQHVITAPCTGVVVQVLAQPGDTLKHEQTIILLRPQADSTDTQIKTAKLDLDYIPASLQTLQDRLALTQDDARPEAVAKRLSRGQRTIRENISDLCGGNTLMEYGQLVYAAQRRKRNLEELVKTSPADGVVLGFGTVNQQQFDNEHNRVAILGYDATVMAGTQGLLGHKKTDRLFELTAELNIPIILFTEGGGGRPNDGDFNDITGACLDIKTFHTFGKIKGRKPRIAVNSGFCFAGNAVMFGCCDLKIATQNSWIGMGGPAMIEGGGLGICSPKDVGPTAVQSKNGLVDIVAKNDTEAVQYAKQLVSYFQGHVSDWQAHDQRKLRHLVPEDRKRVYDIRSVINTLADQETFLELKSDYGTAIVTGFIRIEGRALGVIANNPMVLGGAIDAEGADKAAGFINLCNQFNIPIVSLCDTPGFMVGIKSEEEGAVRRCCEMVNAGAGIDVPLLVVVLRKGFGLGSQAMAGGSFSTPVFSISWPTGEFGTMGVEGGVKLGFKQELENQQDEESKQALFDELVEKTYAAGSALSVASLQEIDAVIDPKDTREWVLNALCLAVGR